MRLRRFTRAVLISASLLLTGAIACQAVAAQEALTPFMRVYGPSQPPYGFLQFCDRQPAECAAGGLQEARLQAGVNQLSELDAINRYVNAAIQPATDLEIYGVSEYWTLPATRGDCEDYALLKRHLLIKRGWPPGALVMTVVRDEKGDGHAVLTARIAQGDFVLDNKTDEIRLWHKTGYEFVMRQSYVNPRLWMSLDPRHTIPSAIAGVRREP